MKKKIQKYLEQIEKEKEIKILLACETGSRAWGFHSPDSDYDIRIVYIHRNNWYLSVNEQKDTIEMMLENNDLDISGWELKKSLGLLRKSNPPLLERIQSPIIYKEDEEFAYDILNTAKSCYSKIATIHHYLSMAKKIKEEISMEKEFKLKKFFYALRTATVCKWIIEKEEIPPIEFPKVLSNLNIDNKVVGRIKELIELKSTKSESYFHSGENDLMMFMEDCIKMAEEKKNLLSPGNCSMGKLNNVLRKYVKKYDY